MFETIHIANNSTNKSELLDEESDDNITENEDEQENMTSSKTNFTVNN
jgi:hypothetical protein